MSGPCDKPVGQGFFVATNGSTAISIKMQTWPGCCIWSCKMGFVDPKSRSCPVGITLDDIPLINLFNVTKPQYVDSKLNKITLGKVPMCSLVLIQFKLGIIGWFLFCFVYLFFFFLQIFCPPRPIKRFPISKKYFLFHYFPLLSLEICL